MPLYRMGDEYVPIPADDSRLGYAREVRDKYLPWLRTLPGFFHAETGLKEIAGRPVPLVAIRIRMLRKLPLDQVPPHERIPPFLDGVPTDVLLAPHAVHMQLIYDETRYSTIVGGICIGWCAYANTQVGGLGTLGAVGRDRTDGKTVLLTNWHVIPVGGYEDYWHKEKIPGTLADFRDVYDGRYNMNVGDGVAQPAPGGPTKWICPKDMIGTALRGYPGTTHGSFCDSSLVLHTSRGVKSEIKEIGPPKGIAAPEVGMPVRKRGARTGLSNSVITALDTGVAMANYASMGGPDIGYDPNQPNVFGLVTVFNKPIDTPITRMNRKGFFIDHGDSGSVAVDAGNRVVLHMFAADDDIREAYGTPIAAVQDRLAFDILIGEGPIPTPPPSGGGGGTPPPTGGTPVRPPSQPPVTKPSPTLTNRLKIVSGRFFVGNIPYRVMGARIDGLAGDAATNLSNPEWPLVPEDAADAFSRCRSYCGAVVRCSFAQLYATGAGERVWFGLDNVIAAATDAGVRLFVTLASHFPEGEWPFEQTLTEDWYAGGYLVPQPGEVTSYKDYVLEVAARYKDNATIGAYVLVDEAMGSGGAMSAFAADMAAAIRAVDLNHLITVGTNGATLSSGEFAAVHGHAAIEFCEVHDYGANDDPLPSWVAGHMAAVKGARKPVVAVGGMTVTEVEGLPLETPVSRAEKLTIKMNAFLAHGGQGYLIRRWAHPKFLLRDYAFSQGDPLCRQICTLSLMPPKPGEPLPPQPGDPDEPWVPPPDYIPPKSPGGGYNPTPTGDFWYIQQNWILETALRVYFMSDAYTITGTIKEVRWNFGDGRTGVQRGSGGTLIAVNEIPTFQHEYDAPGTYTVTWQIVGADDALSVVISHEVVVKPPADPDHIPKCSFQVDYPAPLTVRLLPTATTFDGGPITMISWRFDGPVVGIGSSITVEGEWPPDALPVRDVVFGMQGEYTVVLLVVDSNGLWSDPYISVVNPLEPCALPSAGELPPVGPAANVVAHFRLNDGGPDLHDSVGGITLRPNGGSVAYRQKGVPGDSAPDGAVRLSGCVSGDAPALRDLLLTGDFSVECWINSYLADNPDIDEPGGVGVYARGILSLGTGGGQDGLQFIVSGDSCGGGVRGGILSGFVAPVGDRDWHHLVLTAKSVAVSALTPGTHPFPKDYPYPILSLEWNVDGIRHDSTYYSWPEDLDLPGTTLFLGTYANNDPRRWPVNLGVDEVAFYDKKLTDTEIYHQYLKGRSRDPLPYYDEVVLGTPDLVHYWDFSSINYTTIPDRVSGQDMVWHGVSLDPRYPDPEGVMIKPGRWHPNFPDTYTTNGTHISRASAMWDVYPTIRPCYGREAGVFASAAAAAGEAPSGLEPWTWEMWIKIAANRGDMKILQWGGLGVVLVNPSNMDHLDNISLRWMQAQITQTPQEPIGVATPDAAAFRSYSRLQCPPEWPEKPISTHPLSSYNVEPLPPHYIALVYDGERLALWVNGNQAGEATPIELAPEVNPEVSLAGNTMHNNVAFYRRALTQEEILLRWQKGFLHLEPGEIVEGRSKLTLRPSADGGRAWMFRGFRYEGEWDQAVCVDGYRHGAPSLDYPRDDTHYLEHNPYGENPVVDGLNVDQAGRWQTYESLQPGRHDSLFYWQLVHPDMVERIRYLRWKIRARKVGTGHTLISLIVNQQIGGIFNPSVTQIIGQAALTESFQDYVFTFAHDPFTGIAWQPVTLQQYRVGIRGLNIGERVQVSWVGLEMSYDPLPLEFPPSQPEYVEGTHIWEGYDPSGSGVDYGPPQMQLALIDSFSHYTTAELGGSDAFEGNIVRSWRGAALNYHETWTSTDPLNHERQFLKAPSRKWPSAYGDATIAAGEGPRGGGALKLVGHTAGVARFPMDLDQMSMHYMGQYGFRFKLDARPAPGEYVRLLTLYQQWDSVNTPYAAQFLSLDLRGDDLRLVVNRTEGVAEGFRGPTLVSPRAINDVTQWNYLEIRCWPTSETQYSLCVLKVNGEDFGQWWGINLSLESNGKVRTGWMKQDEFVDYCVLGGDVINPVEPHNRTLWITDYYMANLDGNEIFVDAMYPLGFYGDVAIECLYPIGTKRNDGWVPVGAATPHECVLDPTSDEDATYLRGPADAGLPPGTLRDILFAWPKLDERDPSVTIPMAQLVMRSRWVDGEYGYPDFDTTNVNGLLESADGYRDDRPFGWDSDVADPFQTATQPPDEEGGLSTLNPYTGVGGFNAWALNRLDWGLTTGGWIDESDWQRMRVTQLVLEVMNGRLAGPRPNLWAQIVG